MQQSEDRLLSCERSHGREVSVSEPSYVWFFERQREQLLAGVDCKKGIQRKEVCAVRIHGHLHLRLERSRTSGGKTENEMQWLGTMSKDLFNSRAGRS